jgi:hypothetical protein
MVTLPKDIPQANFWSLKMYDKETQRNNRASE